MRKNIIFVLLITILSIQIIFSQVNAGSVPVGTSSANPYINLSVKSIGQTVSDSFDIDCDGITDMCINLYKGPTSTDGANMIYLRVTNNAFEMCSDTAAAFKHLPFYNSGAALNCMGNYDWGSDSIYIISSYGCMDCFGLPSANNLYLAYRKTGGTPQIGWIKISFNLVDGGSNTFPITFSITEILSLCDNPNDHVAYISSKTNVTCINTSTGSATATVDGGIGPFTYSWAPGGQTTQTVTGLSAGTYTVIVTDQDDLSTAGKMVSISEPTSILYSAIISQSGINCNGNATGSATVTAFGGTPGYTYNWLPSGGTKASATNLTEGTYTVNVTDASGCTTSQTVFIYQVKTSINPSSVTVCRDSCTTLVSTVTGGSAPYMYTWNPGGDPPDIIVVCPPFTINFTLTVTDVNGCWAMATATVTVDSVTCSVGIQEKENIPNFIKNYPNPFSDNTTFIIQSDKIKENYTFELLDVLGKQVRSIKEINSNEFQISRNSLPNGIYFYKVYNAENIVGVGKLIIK
ncbi:MAG: T9SS type A sorting domain-containing protein [Bacteroidota bacterium]